VIILDTNVLSEALRPEPDAAVMAWLAAQSTAAMFTTTVTRADLLYGVGLLPAGRRHDDLHAAVVAILDEDMAGRVLPFDKDAADAYADIAVARKRAGQPLSQFDAMIAGIARSRGATVATHNSSDFVDCGIELANPWA